MTEIYGLFDAADPEAPDRVYTSEAFARLFRTIMRDGIVHNDGDELAVGPTVPAAMSVSVGTGMALVQGRYLINDADLTLPVEAANPSYPRIDRVVVRADLVGRTVHAVVKKGTPAPSPVPPGLTRTPETWELSLAQISVAAGATMVQAANITDERGNASLCGVAAPAYVPSSQLEVVGAVDMQGKALTGLPVPSAGTDAARRDMGGTTLQNLGAPVNANDAARKAYVDDKVAGFGISQIAIDANKDWNGKNITNLGNIYPKTKLSAAFDVPLKSGGISFAVGPQVVSGSTVRVDVHTPYHSTYSSGGATITRTLTLARGDGTVVASVSQDSGFTGMSDTVGWDEGTIILSESLPVAGGEMYTFSITHGTGTLIVYGLPLLPIDQLIQ